jgi:DNA polymerase-3 subunit alpha
VKLRRAKVSAMSDSSPVSFIHLRTHSAYSLSEGALPIKLLGKLAVQHKMPDGLSGLLPDRRRLHQMGKAQGIPVGPGRGSGAGSLVAWALTITDLDPLRFGLLFERFLNPERVSMPDFDIDFCQTRRDEVIRYVQQKYGATRSPRSSPSESCRPAPCCATSAACCRCPTARSTGCKLVPNNPANPVTLPEAIEEEPRLQEERDQTRRDAARDRAQAGGLYRHASTHAAGVVIGDRPLDELVPLYRDPRSTCR